MKNDNSKKLIIALPLLIFTICFILFPKNILASGDTSLVIQPSKVEITVSPGQKAARSFSVINRSNFYIKLKLVVKDYRQVSADGKLEFYDAPEEGAETWLVPQFVEIGLKPLETKDVGFVVNIPDNFSGGGHYGAILFQSADNANNININNFGELILLTVSGKDNKNTVMIKSENFWTNIIQQGNPVDFNFKLQNNGNTHFDTQSKLILKDWLGREVGNYNIGLLTVYPKTSRLFRWRWNGTPNIGIYRADIMVLNKSSNTYKSIDGIWFIIFPWEIASIVLLIGLIIYSFFTFRKRNVRNKFYKWINKKWYKNNVKIKDLSAGVISIPIKKLLK